MFNYLARQPEHLVLHGYRCWTQTAALGSDRPWREAERLYCACLGERNAIPALDALKQFVGIAGLCARCPLRILGPGARALCRDEVLVLGLVSGLQNGDDAASAFCAGLLARQRMAGHVAAAAGAYAATMRACGKSLLPVPLDVLRDICAHPFPPGSDGCSVH